MRRLLKPLAILLRWTALIFVLMLILGGAERGHRAWVDRTAGPAFEKVGEKIGGSETTAKKR